MDRIPPWLQGLFAVLPTPMRAGGALDLESLDRVVDHYLDGGAAGVVPASIAGEGDLMDEAERRRVIERVVRHVRGRAPVVVGILADGLEAALAETRVAADGGARGLLVKPPPGGDPAAVAFHVGEIGRASGLPIVLLDNPAFGAALPASLVERLVDTVPEVCGIKLEEEPTPDKMALVRARLGPRIRIFGGLGGAHGLRELEQGADGFFTGNPCPQHLVAALRCFRAGDREGAVASFEALRPVTVRERTGMIVQRKAILLELGVLRDAATRPLRAGASPQATTGRK